MSSKRFEYLGDVEAQPTTVKETSAAPKPTVSVPRGQGRMQQDREQLNVRIPTQLKRQAVAKATLSGETIGEVIERLLQRYLEAN